MTSTKYFFVLFASVILAVSSFASSSEVDSASGNRDFSFLVFAQIWPITSCDIWESRSESNVCFLPKEIGGRWTVHGIWPSTGHGKGPFDCNHTLPFDPDALEPIKEKLDVQWTDVRMNGPKDDFWNHEWTKHGTCAIQLEPMNTELKYFSKGLELNDEYDISQILTKASIVPGYGYTGKEIMEKLTTALGKVPGIGCVKNEKRFGDDKEGKMLLSQVEICLDKSLQLIDCEPNIYGECSPSKPINYYPKKTHRTLQLETTTSMVVGLVAVFFCMIVAAICLYVCYRRNVIRYRGYENI